MNLLLFHCPKTGRETAAALSKKRAASLAADIEATDEKIDGVKTEMIDQFEHVDAQFRAANDRLRGRPAAWRPL